VSMERRRRLFAILLGLALLQLIVLYGVVPQLDRSARGRGFRSAKAHILRQLQLALSSFGVEPEWVKDRDGVRLVRLPLDLPPVRVFAAIAEAVRQAGGAIIQSREDEVSGRIEFTVARNRAGLQKVVLIPDRKLLRRGGRIALIIDDWGYGDAAMLEAFLALPETLSFAVIPGLPHSRELAERIRESGQPLLIHLPMEPLEGKVESDGFTIQARLSEGEIRQRLRRALQEVPGAVGVNNHMGSKATLDDRLLAVLMDEIHREGLFFVDSRTNPETHAFDWAGRKQVPAALNDLFLDVRPDEGWIRTKIEHLARVASRKGSAVGIGHPRKVTLRVLRQMLPLLERRGYRFVPITEVLE